MPEPAGAVLSVLCFWGWVGAMSLFALRAFGKSGQIHRATARIWGGLSLLFFFLWVAGLRLV